MTSESRLHIPHPSARPGDEPDFSYLSLSEAGAVARPDPDTPASKIENGKQVFDVYRCINP